MNKAFIKNRIYHSLWLHFRSVVFPPLFLSSSSGAHIVCLEMYQEPKNKIYNLLNVFPNILNQCSETFTLLRVRRIFLLMPCNTIYHKAPLFSLSVSYYENETFDLWIVFISFYLWYVLCTCVQNIINIHSLAFNDNKVIIDIR